jgi:hypothetical protein
MPGRKCARLPRRARVIRMSRQQPFPWLTTITLGVTAALTATRLTGDGVLDAVRRDPAALRHGQLWRLGSPVLVQSDRSPVTVLAVFALCAAIGAFAERLLSRRRWIAVYAVGALAGHSIGEAFQSHQSGTSVAFFGPARWTGCVRAPSARPPLVSLAHPRRSRDSARRPRYCPQGHPRSRIPRWTRSRFRLAAPRHRSRQGARQRHTCESVRDDIGCIEINDQAPIILGRNVESASRVASPRDAH